MKKYFSAHLLAWYDEHGRRDLPWQQKNSAYLTWVSEIMLQQTQVKTVIPYYHRFIKRFPTLADLALSRLDEVLDLWSGLGYYARARNLHKTAQIIHKTYQGSFPQEIEAVIQLPGVGRSTAGAILTLCFGQCHPILDGNVKRVLSRYHAIEGWPGKAKIAKKLWALAEEHTPLAKTADYTQAIMDLGATLCTRSKPDCMQCPVNADCRAFQQQQVNAYPSPKPKRKAPIKQTYMLGIFNRQNQLLLTKRPPTGIWGGLWSLPEHPDGTSIEAWAKKTLGYSIVVDSHEPPVKHVFSHFQLNIHPIRSHVTSPSNHLMDSTQQLWYNQQQVIGLAAPVQRIILGWLDTKR